MLKWLVKNSGKICVAFCSCLFVSGVVVYASIISSSVIPAVVFFTIGGCSVGSLIFGCFYIGRELGDYIRHENNLSNEIIEHNREIDSESEILNSENQTINSHHSLSDRLEVLMLQVQQSQVHETVQQAQIESLTRRVSDLEGQQAARFHSEARREIHHERMLYGRKFDDDSDSDEESKSNLVAQGVFANDVPDLGVEIRHRNNTRK